MIRGALALVRALAPAPTAPLDEVGVGLLGERAAIAGLSRQGPSSAGGAFRMLRSARGWVGLNLPRVEDRDLLPALTRGAVGRGGGHGRALTDWMALQVRDEVTERARLLGLPLVKVAGPEGPEDEQQVHRWGDGPADWLRVEPGGTRFFRRHPLVVLLASLWAGPLAAHLLGLAGCRVVVVESVGRPDRTRDGAPMLHDLLHAGQESVALALPDRAAVDILRSLLEWADVVVDASRPRALRQLGVPADDIVARGTIWVSITGYGRTGPWADQPAFGDDAAASAGLVACDGAGPVPAGDAIADPLAGVHAAVAALGALRTGRAWMLDLAMRDVAYLAARPNPGAVVGDLSPREPAHRQPPGKARPIGADTDAIVDELERVK